jgi:glycosyltransferase involved in cell wall biosynthesis
MIGNSALPMERPGRIGYMARICPEKGLDRLIDTLAILRRRPGMEQVQLKAAGYLSPAHQSWFDDLRRRIAGENLERNFEYLGEVSLEQKKRLLMEVDVVSVPAAFPEPKGLYVLEALAQTRPVVLPNHGAFPELIQMTGGGALVPPGDAAALAGAIEDLLLDRKRSAELGDHGRGAVEAGFTEDHMAARMARIFEEART